MENNNTNNKIKSENQSGGITAQQVFNTTNNYGAFSQLSLIFKNKAVKWSAIVLILFGSAFGLKQMLFSKHMNAEQFYKFLLVYFQSINEKNTDAHDYFVSNISTFYTEKNITPDRVNRIRAKSDFTDNRFDIDKSSIKLEKTIDGVDYWSFKSGYICYRPSKKIYTKCKVEMEFGINADGKITSIRQGEPWESQPFVERPGW